MTVIRFRANLGAFLAMNSADETLSLLPVGTHTLWSVLGLPSQRPINDQFNQKRKLKYSIKKWLRICDAYESVTGIDKEQMNRESDAYGGLSQDHLANSSDCCSIASDSESSIDETDGYVWETEFSSNESYSLHEDAQQFAGKKRTTTLDNRFFEPLYEVTIFDYHISLFHFSLKHCLTKQDKNKDIKIL